MPLGQDTDLLYDQRILKESGIRTKKKKILKGKEALKFLAKKMAASLRRRPGTAGTSSDPHDIGGSIRTVMPLTFSAREDSAVLGTLDRHHVIERGIDIEDEDTMPAALKKKRPFIEGRKLHYRTSFQDLPISIENRKKSVRKGVDPDGEEWKTKMKVPYGYIPGTKGADGDEVDVFVGSCQDAAYAYVVHSNNIETGKFDEDKVMLGFSSSKSAKNVFMQHYDDPKFFGGIDRIPMWKFRKMVWIKKHTTKRLVASGFRESSGFSSKSLIHPEEPNVGGQAQIFTSVRKQEGGPGSGPHPLQNSLDNAHGKVLMARGDLKMAVRMKNNELINKRNKELENAIKERQAIKDKMNATESQEGGPGSGPRKGGYKGEGYKQDEKISGKPKNDAIDIVSQHAAQIPKKTWIEKAGGEYIGAMDNPKGGKIHGFRDPKTGSTMWMRDHEIKSQHDVLDQMRRSRVKFAKKGSKESGLREGRIYYARPLSVYESDREDRDLDFLEGEFPGEELIAPRTCESEGTKDMAEYHKKVDEADAVIIRPHRMRRGVHRVTAGVFSEAQHALHKGIPVRMIHNGKLYKVRGFKVRRPARADGDFADVILRKKKSK